MNFLWDLILLLQKFVLACFMSFHLLEPLVSIDQHKYDVDESIGILKITLKRQGDISKVTSVRCITKSGL